MGQAPIVVLGVSPRFRIGSSRNSRGSEDWWGAERGLRPLPPTASPARKMGTRMDSGPVWTINYSYRAVCQPRLRAGFPLGVGVACHAPSHVPKYKEDALVKLTLREQESAQEAVRRFRKLVERSGIKKEMRVREFYEKPSETRRRSRLRAQRRSRRERLMNF